MGGEPRMIFTLRHTSQLAKFDEFEETKWKANMT